MNYVVIDLEMCRTFNTERSKTEYKLKNEIIEIGAVLLGENYEITDRFMTYVFPEYGAVDSFIKRLTGITNNDTKNAPLLKDALSSFEAWLPDDSVIVEWSEADESQLRKETHAKGISIPKLSCALDNYIDCQALFTQKMDTPKVYRLSEALSITDIDYKEGAHDALVDAVNTAYLFKKIRTEEKLILNSYYVSQQEESHLSYNPFADFFKNYHPEDESD